MKQLAKTALLIFILSSCADAVVEEVGSEWKSIERDLQTQLITTRDSAVIELPEGSFMFTKSLTMDGKKHLTLKGKGIDKTILSFESQEEGAEGLKISNAVNVTLEDFTIENAKGDNIKITDTEGIVMRRVKSQWTGEPQEENGAYAFYPVLSKNILIEECIAIGASDAGIYVGQSDSVIVRNNEAYYNVAGIESENSKWVEISNNFAHDNTGGILVFDLPGLTQYGHTTQVINNKVFDNNFRNFAPAGNVVATVPPGTGIMLLATRDIEIQNNEIVDNRTIGAAIISYEIVEALATTDQSQLNENIDKSRKDKNYDPYPKNIYIHDNIFQNSYWFGDLSNDFGQLFLLKFPFSTPDIIWDGFVPSGGNVGLCIQQSDIKFANIDAGGDFADLSTDITPFECEGKSINLTLLE
ncbi:MAG: right-handed parallel beta-helix repeat-containing protein [Cyclobacteriaceae bacterium]